MAGAKHPSPALSGRGRLVTDFLAFVRIDRGVGVCWEFGRRRVREGRGERGKKKDCWTNRRMRNYYV